MIDTALEQAFTEHRRLLWGLGYRMLGTAADADEVVQDAFERALRRPPATDRPLRPWLVKVVVNASRDRLRRRRRSPYVGPWLPGVIPLEPSVDPEDPAGRLESVSYALMVALERLTPTQRAVWLLREVMGLTTAEAASVLEVQPGSVKVTLHRARKALDGVETDGVAPDGLAAVGALAGAILAGDVEAVARLLSDDVVALSDGGGVFHAARNAIEGPDRVAKLLVGLASKAGAHAEYEPVIIQGIPGVRVHWPGAPEGFARESITLFSLSSEKVARVWSVLSPSKLALPGGFG